MLQVNGGYDHIHDPVCNARQPQVSIHFCLTLLSAMMPAHMYLHKSHMYSQVLMSQAIQHPKYNWDMVHLCVYVILHVIIQADEA